ncbi:MAG: LytR C-terminal domain-containing protein, partial [Solirubrobacterales bacterium]
PDEREAFRRAELARQAAERRQRFQQRRQAPGAGRPAWLSNGRSTAVIVVGALILVAGVAFGATRLIGGGEGDGEGAQRSQAPRTKVAVLNSTAEPGLAAEFAKLLKPADFEVGPVSNTDTPFEESVVMFDTGAEETARQVGSRVGIQATEPLSTEIRGVAEGAAVVVVLGEDKAGGATDSTDSTEGTDTTSGVEGI